MTEPIAWSGLLCPCYESSCLVSILASVVSKSYHIDDERGSWLATFRSLVAWESELCHLQYGFPFSSCTVGNLRPSGIFNCFSLSRRSKICSVLVTSKSKPLGGPGGLTHLQDTGLPPSPFSHCYLLISRRNFVFLCLDQDYARLNLSWYKSGGTVHMPTVSNHVRQ
ncbi:hypothetical protein QYE76_034689 [Lolium multiflorum]|uniref:Uncharacterized protein n=1 Tax=Lolium multiflorum TaxID=4521 RepID=A0AAD8VMS3_LOLMU|nr:hypothetical protein QYE76_034689 [Lolium multiflorum]